jgi:hypothetical protein
MDESKEITANYFTGSNYDLFLYLDRQYYKIPFNLNIKIINGIFILEGEKEMNLLKNMNNCYPSSIYNGNDSITNEKQTLKIYRIMEICNSHNIFSGILYIVMVLTLKKKTEICDLLIKKLNICNLNIINTDYYRNNLNENCRKLAIIETKIYFWWNLFNKDKKVNDIQYFKFYMWVFNNLESIDNPYIIGEKIKLSYKSYFSLINNFVHPAELFILRYGSKYLNNEELINEPTMIFTVLDLNGCKLKF